MFDFVATGKLAQGLRDIQQHGRTVRDGNTIHATVFHADRT